MESYMVNQTSYAYMILKDYIYRLEAHLYLILYVGHNNVTTFPVNAKTSYLPYMRKHTYNNGTFHIYIYISGEKVYMY